MKSRIYAAVLLAIIVLQLPGQFFLIQSQYHPAPSQSKKPSVGIVFAKTWSSLEPLVGLVGKAVVVDSQGESYIVASGRPGLIILSYDSSGRLLWERQWTGGGGNDLGNGIAIDSTGNIYVTGLTYSPITQTDQLLLLKFDRNENLVWQKSWGTSHAETEGYALAIDPSTNSIYVSGYVYIPGSGSSSTLLKFGSDGSLDWAVGFTGISLNDCDCEAIALDSSGVYVAGEIARFVPPYGSQATVLKFSLNGTLLWSRAWGDAGFTQASGIALGSMQNVYVTGGTGLDSGVFLLNLNSTGSLIWQRTWGGDGYDEGRAIVAKFAVGVYLAGRAVISGARANIFLLNFAANGSLVSQQTWGGHDGAEGYGVAVGPDGGVLITGSAGAPPYRLNSTNSNLGYPTDNLTSLGSVAETAAGTLSSPVGVVTTPSGTESYDGQSSVVLLKYGVPAALVPLTYRVSFITNASGTITFYWSTYSNGETNYFIPGAYDIRANPPRCFELCFGPNYLFSNWMTTGGVRAETTSCNPTKVRVDGPGTLEAVFKPSGASTPICLFSNLILAGTIIALWSATLLVLIRHKRLSREQKSPPVKVA